MVDLLDFFNDNAYNNNNKNTVDSRLLSLVGECPDVAPGHPIPVYFTGRTPYRVLSVPYLQSIRRVPMIMSLLLR